MFIIKSDLSEEEKKTLFNQINDTIIKNNGVVIKASVWQDKRKLCYPIKKYQEGLYYLMNFNLTPLVITKIKSVYKLNENILRFLITKIE